MANYKDLFYGQLGIETAYGCDAAPTLKLMGLESLEIVPVRETTQNNVLDGRMAPSATLVRTKHYGTAQISSKLVYEDSGLWLDGAFGAAASTAVAACTTDATGVQRIYAAPLATYNTDAAALPMYTLIYGDTQTTATDSFVYSLISGQVGSFSISGEVGSPSMIEVSLFGQDVEADALDATKVDRDVSFVMGDHWKLWIDPDTDAAGTTGCSDVAFKFNLQVNCNRTPMWHLGSITPDSFYDLGWDGTLDLTIQLGVAAKAIVTSLLASTPVRKVVRLKATSSSNSFQIDFNGALLEAPTMWTDQDGIATIEMSLTGVYGATLGNWLKITTHNGVSAHSTML